MAKAKEKQIAQAAYEDLPQAKLSRQFSSSARRVRPVLPSRIGNGGLSLAPAVHSG